VSINRAFLRELLKEPAINEKLNRFFNLQSAKIAGFNL
jgi:hypothetical protein